jgi:hypothetical protein
MKTTGRKTSHNLGVETSDKTKQRLSEASAAAWQDPEKAERMQKTRRYRRFDDKVWWRKK